MDFKKNIEKSRVGIEILFSFVNLHYPYELQLNLHNLHINSILKYIKYFTPRVGIEKLSSVVEWAAKIYYCVMSGPLKVFL